MTVARPRVAVVGAGTTGAMTLWRLARRGIPAVGFDLFAPGHDRGAAGGESRIFRTAYREGTRYVPLLQSSLQLWRELEDETDRNLLTLTGGLTLGARSHPDVQTVLASAQQEGVEAAVLEPGEARARYPQHPLGTDEVAVIDPQAGVLRPELAVHAAAARAEQLGAQVQRYTSVCGLEPAGRRVRVVAGDASYEFDHVVLAPGPWTDSGLLAGIPLEPRQITTCWLPPRDPASYTPERFPIAIRVGEYGFSCFPSIDGAGVKVSLHSSPRPAVHPDELPRSADVEFVAELRATVTRMLPGLYPDPLRVGVYADSFTPDGHPVVGRLPGHDNVTALAGFSGHGFKLAPVFGEIAADLAVDGGTIHDIAHLDPERSR